jgi:hypothetical protein
VIGPPVLLDCCNIAIVFIFLFPVLRVGDSLLLINKKVPEDQNGIRRF